MVEEIKKRKNELRSKIKKLSLSISKETRVNDDNLICSQVLDFIYGLRNPEIIGWYLPIDKLEPNILPALQKVFMRTKIIHQHAVISLNDGFLTYHLITQQNINDLESLGPLDQLPKSIFSQEILPSIYFIPALGFNEKKIRLGSGQGHFDRFLSKVETKSTLIGFCYPWQINLPFEEEPHDKGCHQIFCGK